MRSGESFPHLHAHLIPRYPDKPETFAWAIADHYRGTAR
jgi:diadenosine tetraphosphate (Ap4A) HIT family hydrolase